MIKLKNLRLPLQADEKTIKSLAAKKLRLSTEKILSVRFLKKSIDARKKTDIFYAVSLGVDVRSHLGVPASGLMTIVDACFEQTLHGYDCHFVFLL